jgi:predicted membrane protein
MVTVINFIQNFNSGGFKMDKRNCEEKQFDRRLGIGIGFFLVGLLILANNFGIFEYELHKYIFKWQVILIFFGVVSLAGKGHRTTGIILLIIGGIFYLRDFMHFTFTFWQIFWPSLLILAGVMIIFRHKIDSDRESVSFKKYSDDFIDEVAVFGGGDRVVTSQQFKGGKVTAVFGGLNFNLLNARLAPGENYIDVFCLFGGMKLVVPEGWTVKVRVLSLFGGFGGQNRYKSTISNTDLSSQLIIKGTVIFGGGDIKNHLD